MNIYSGVSTFIKYIHFPCTQGTFGPFIVTELFKNFYLFEMWSYFIDQVGLQLSIFLLPQPLEPWDCRYELL